MDQKRMDGLQFPGGPVVRTHASTAGAMGLIPGMETKLRLHKPCSTAKNGGKKKRMDGWESGKDAAAAAAAAKLLQLCPTLCDPIEGSPRGSSVPGIFQARILEWVAISFSR